MEHCPYCASPVPSGAARCPACGSSLFAPAHNLAQGTRLKGGQYTLGKVLGQGGFGITYLGADTRRQQPVAIKELFPEGAVRRASRVIPPTSLAGNGFLETMKRFEDEGRRSEDLPLVHWAVRDSFARAWKALDEVLRNHPARRLGQALLRWIAPWGVPDFRPTDQLVIQIAEYV
ncbi:MAG: DUF1974 domain-containing protein, partial [Meiothermus silvanus]|nr:DUF1974 domain-containing protein [Allomeiothermus silvanus]